MFTHKKQQSELTSPTNNSNLFNKKSRPSFAGSPNHPQLIAHPTVIGNAPKQSKNKKRKMPNGGGGGGNPHSPDSENGVAGGGGAAVVRRKASVKKQPPAAKQRAAQPNPNQELPQGAEGAEGNLPSPYDSASLYSNALPSLVAASGVTHVQGSVAAAVHSAAQAAAKQPPAYEDCIKTQGMQQQQQNR